MSVEKRKIFQAGGLTEAIDYFPDELVDADWVHIEDTKIDLAPTPQEERLIDLNAQLASEELAEAIPKRFPIKKKKIEKPKRTNKKPTKVTKKPKQKPKKKNGR